MKLIFNGHNYRYAVEQSLLAFFPNQRPIYEGEDEDTAIVSLTAGNTAASQTTGDKAAVSQTAGGTVYTAATILTVSGQTGRGTSQADLSGVADGYERERILQRIVKLSFFEAARTITGITPPWGALTGIRPAKMVRTLLAQGNSLQETDRLLRDVYCVSEERRALALACAAAGQAAEADRKPEDISLYVGIPFCPTRCAYCSFVSSSVEKSLSLVEPYLDALLKEIVSAGEMVKALGLRIKSFYMGGGTPTTLTAAQLERVMTALCQHFDLSRTVERTVEAGRPDTITPDKLAVLRRYGINRVSVNPQSMDNRVLAAIGRRHTAQDIRHAMAMVRDAGFPHVNMDLIAGLPEDTVTGFCQSLDEVLAMEPDNVTVHTLSRKKGSRLTLALEGNGGHHAFPTEEAVAAMLAYAGQTLRTEGFVPYYLYRQKYMAGSFENVGWSRPGGECLYNIYIMEELHTILSLGAGGSTKLVDPRQNRIERVFHLKFPQEYIGRPEKITDNQKAFRAFYEKQGILKET